MQIIFAIFPFISTLIGGLLGLRYKDKLHIILGFSAGVVLSVVALDILPELFELSKRANFPIKDSMIFFVIGFFLFHILEKLLLIHSNTHSHYKEHSHQLNKRHPTIGLISALALSGHSFLDGVGIGLSFQISTLVGFTVLLAVVAHDFSDGLNTVAVMLAHRHSDRKATTMLVIDAIAPVLGALSTMVFKIPQNLEVLYLAFFAGFLLYIGTSEVLPEAHSEHPSRVTLLMTVLGVVFIYFVTRVL